MLKRGATDPKYLASCFGKERHNTYEAARAKADTKPHYVKPYKCDYCKNYHIGRRRRQ